MSAYELATVHFDTPSTLRYYRSDGRTVAAVQWPQSWEKQALIAKYIGMSGIVFQFVNGHKEPSRDQPLPQLHMYTHRYDMMTVRVGDYIVFKGNRRFAVLPGDEFREEYERQEAS